MTIVITDITSIWGVCKLSAMLDKFVVNLDKFNQVVAESTKDNEFRLRELHY